LSGDRSGLQNVGRGALIVVEGPHQSGKSTQARRLVRRFSTIGFTATLTKEPFSHEMSSLIRGEANGIDDYSRYALLFALLLDRCIHLRFIGSRIRESEIVVCDRYTPSTMVYQRMHGFDLDFLKSLTQFAPEPCLYLFLHTTLEERLKRARSDPRWNSSPFMSPHEFELEQRYYDDACQQLAKDANVHVIEGDRPEEEVEDEIWTVAQEFVQE